MLVLLRIFVYCPSCASSVLSDGKNDVLETHSACPEPSMTSPHLGVRRSSGISTNSCLGCFDESGDLDHITWNVVAPCSCACRAVFWYIVLACNSNRADADGDDGCSPVG